MILSNLTPVLAKAVSEGYGVGSFSARSTYLIEAVLDAAQAKNSPVIVQISANEFGWFGITPAQFAKRFYEIKDRYSIPAVLHLDHTRDVAVIRDAIDAGFTSVMIDQSAQPFEENARITREVVELAHPRGVSVEAELGSIGGADIKLSAACAFMLGTVQGMTGLMIGLILAVIINSIKNRKKKHEGFPLIPYLAVGFMTAYFM